MTDSTSIKVKELLARHSELEQSETKAQAALVTILSLTQITELKLLLDIGRQGHRFYDFVLTLLIACISLEIFVGVVIIYIGNLHYYRAITSIDHEPSDKGSWTECMNGCCRLCMRPARGKTAGPYQSVHELTTSVTDPTSHVTAVPSLRRSTVDPDDSGTGGSERFNPLLEPLIDLERADAAIELAKVKAADADVRIVRAAGYVRVVEEALRKAAGRNGDLESELARARDDLSGAQREKAESEAERRLAEAHRRRAVHLKEHRDEQQERTTFRQVSYWQHGATYLLYFIMLMNVFITTFGISAGPVASPTVVSPTYRASVYITTHSVPSLPPVRHNVSDMQL